MLDFGEELTLESFRIPWLIGIQLIVLLLLLALFFLLSLDDSATASTASASVSSASASASAAPHRLQKSLPNNHVSSSTALNNRLQNTRGVENLSIKGEIETSSSTRIVREEIAEGEASSLYFLHPCHYFKLARVAFLKCLGLDSTSESDSPPIRKHRKRKES